MIRDPFDIHRKSTFRASSSRTAQKYRDSGQAGPYAAEGMAFSIPRNLPNFEDPTRSLEDRAWAATSRRGGGNGRIFHEVQDRVTGMFDTATLPMYKDKPYAYSPSMRRRRWWRRKRLLGMLAAVVVFLLYLMGLFSGRPAMVPVSGWTWLSSSKGSADTDWLKRREHVVEAFQLSWDAYERYAWGYDEFHPVSKKGKTMAPSGLGWIIVDSLDTLMLMNQTTRLQHAREWLADSLTWHQDQAVNLFETSIRMLGGLLSAHYLSTEFPDMAPLDEDNPGTAGEDLYLEKAKDLADRLLAAFESPSGIPYASVNLANFQAVPAHFDSGASSTAEVASVQMEYKYMAKLTGEKNFWDVVEKVMKVIDDNDSEAGLVPIFIEPTTGHFVGSNIRLGSRGDSYYEYLIKQYLQTNKQEPVYEEMWEQALQGVREHLVTYTEPSGFTIVGEKPDGIGNSLSPKMDHLVCFLPGTIALAATGGLTEAEAKKLPSWSKKKESEMQLARELMHTCWGMYKYMATGLAAEITYFEIAEPHLPEGAPHNPPANFDADPEATWRQDFVVKQNDVHNLQRPETVESLFYMWRITGDVKYREWGWDMFTSFVEHTAVAEKGGFTSLSNANVIPPKVRDNMESFWLAETLKYFYLLFSPNDLLPLDKVVFNTEAHPLPRFDMGQLFFTGWQRQQRGADGRIVQETTGEDPAPAQQ